MPEPTAAVLVIGNEVLSAKVRDENGPWVAARLRELGVRLVSIVTLLDRVEDIVEAVRRERPRVTWLFTSGGVGPTHDDVTLRAVADALGRPVVRSPELTESIRAAHARWGGGGDLTEAALRMADVPQGTRLLGDPGYPILAVENVVMLPGVPQFFRAQFDRIAHTLKAPPFHLACVYVRLAEDRIAAALDALTGALPDVEVGSYPRFDDADHRVKITLESRDPARVRAATAELLERLPPGAVVRTEGF